MINNISLEIEITKILNKNDTIKEISLGENLSIYFIETIVDRNLLIHILGRLSLNKDINFNNYLCSIASPITIRDFYPNILNGNIIVLFHDNLLFINESNEKFHRSVPESIRESSIEGSLAGMVENLHVNINLVRQYYINSDLRVKEFIVGKDSISKGVLLYTDKMDVEILKLIEDRLNKVDAPLIHSLRELEQHMVKRQWLFPRMLIVHRPDRIGRYLASGKAVILLNTTPGGLVTPVTFHQYFVSADDYYLYPIPALFLIMLRYLGFFLTIFLPSAYVAITSYNPEILRVQLGLSIAATRIGVTYPSFLEVLFMLVMIEFLLEASIRLPKTVGQAATTVGGLILGQAAVQAQLVSNIMIIVVAIVAIANFTLPTTCLGTPTRILKYIVLIFASFAGIFGIFAGLLSITVYCFSIYNFSIPYTNPVGWLTIKNLKDFFRRELL